LLERLRDQGAEGVAFLIGGADGLSTEAIGRGATALSLGPMTLPHGLARIVLAEQIYRAATILAGHPYHRG
jgi:23S rRNA (pseudouridine1915-N3)-methyltransferase